MVVFLTFLLRRIRIRPILDLLECSVEARYFPVVVILFWMRRFPQRLWRIEPKQNVYYNVVEGDIWHIAPDILDRKYRNSYKMSFFRFEYFGFRADPIFTFHCWYVCTTSHTHFKNKYLWMYTDWLKIYFIKLWIICIDVEGLLLENIRLLFVGYLKYIYIRKI